MPILTLHPNAVEGIKLFNAGKFFEAHEELEIAWRAETHKIRDLYRGILQAAVFYLHITRNNHAGAVKLSQRCLKWLSMFPNMYCGVDVESLRADVTRIAAQLPSPGAEKTSQLNISSFPPILWQPQTIWLCDRCHSEMYENACKISCPNCGNRFDCSDLNLYFD